MPASTTLTTSFAPAGFLINSIRAVRPFVYPLEPSERGLKTGEPGGDLVERGAQLEGERGRCGGVVDVVEAGQAEGDPSLPGGRVEIERRAVEPVVRHGPGGDVEQRTCGPAAGAAVIAEMSDVRGQVDERGAAAPAVLRVGRVRGSLVTGRRIIETEPDSGRPALGEGRQDRVVGVDDHPGRGRQALERGRPALGDDLDSP